MLKHASGYLGLVPLFGCCKYCGYQHSFTSFGWMFILNFESIYRRMELLGHMVIQENCGGNSVKILASSTGRTGVDITVVLWGGPDGLAFISILLFEGCLRKTCVLG